jgi:hypothetical protein
MGVIDMETKLEQEIKEDIKSKDYKDFLNHLGIDPEDFENIFDDIDFDDYSS